MAAAIEMEIAYPEKQLAQLRALFARSPKKIAAIERRAISRATQRATTYAKRAVAQEMGVPVSRIRGNAAGKRKRRLWMRAPRRASDPLEGRLWASYSGIPLAELRPAQTKRGVKASYGGSRRLHEHAFIARMPSGHLGVWKRVTKRRLPIRELYTPQIVSDALEPHARDTLALAGEIMEQETARQIELFMRSRSGN